MIRTVLAPLRNLLPAYFALVMATGIVGVGAFEEGMPVVGVVLLWVNTVAFVVLWALTLIRIVAFPAAFLRDFSDFERGPGYFTIVAGTAVLGCQWLIIYGATRLALALWLLAVPLWVVFIYAIFGAFTVKTRKPGLADGMHGGWLIAVVATQGVSDLGTLLSPALPGYTAPLLFFSLTSWLTGGMLYIWVISLIFYRYTFLRFRPSDLMPPYWINMGAMAISALAGTALARNAGAATFLVPLLPFIQGFTLFFWATATWWIPMLLILGYWRHVSNRFPLRYDPLYWGAVFPLGMYTVSTRQLSEMLGIGFVSWIPRVFVWIALAAWLLTFAGLAHRLAGITASGSAGQTGPEQSC
jgi:tellurite resistance protein TehA-like permease